MPDLTVQGDVAAATSATSGVDSWLELSTDADAAALSSQFAQFPGAAHLTDADGSSALFIGGFGITVRPAAPAGWTRMSVAVDAATLRRLHDGQYGTPSANGTVQVAGLMLELAEAEAAGSAPGTPTADGLGLGGPAAVRVASWDAPAAAELLAGLFGASPGSYLEPALNTSVHAVQLAHFAVEFVSSRTAAESDRIGSFLSAGGERIQSLALPMADLHRVRDRLTRQEIPFTQWGDSVLSLPARVLGGGALELSTTLAGR